MAETMIGLYKTDCVKIDGPLKTVDELELATLSWVHWFNGQRLHSALDYRTPNEYEEKYYRENNPRRHELSGQPAPRLNPGRFTTAVATGVGVVVGLLW